MKKIRNTFLIGIFLAIIAFASALAIPRQAQTDSVVASSTNIKEAFSYVTLSESGKVLDFSNLKSFTDELGATSINIVSNKNISFNFKPLKYNYKYIASNLPADVADNFYIHQEKFEFVATEKNREDKWIFKSDESYFTFEGETYLYELTEDLIDDGIDTRKVRIKKLSNVPVATQEYSDLISFTEEEKVVDGQNVAVRTIYITTTILPDIKNLNSKQFTFEVAGKIFTFTFEQPITNFEQNSPVAFTTQFLANGNPDPSKALNKIPPEETYRKLQLDILNNNYTESNPLFLNINYNGFKYEFKVYSKEYNGKNYLFVNYFDEHKIISDELTTNNQKIKARTSYLATPLTIDTNDKFTVNTTDDSKLIYKTDQFSFNFTYAGRYEVELYDSTYTLGLNSPNYYKESFYIKQDNGGTASIDNIYVVAESIDEEFNHLEYIVTGTVLNNNIKFTIKNVESDIASLEKIVITKTIFGNEANDPVPTTYYPEDILQLLQNGEYVELCTDDASYTIDIYEKATGDKVNSYQYTVLKFPKSQFSDPGAGEYIEKTPYVRTKINYDKFISDKFTFNVRINNSAIDDYNANATIFKTYLDKFTVIYGKIQVDVQQVVELDEEGKEVKSDAKTYQFFGVGTITLTINYNGKVSTKVIGQDDSHVVTFADYGTYEIQMKDEMGTQLTTPLTFKVTKSLNTSALILIILISIIVVAVVAFVMIARTKISTR